MAKGSDNKFPKLIITEGSAPSNADSGDQKLYIDSADHKLKRKNSSGTVVTVESAGTIGGATGSTDNAIIRADGTGGATIQSSLATVDDNGKINIPTGQTYDINGSPHTHAAGGADGWTAATGTWSYSSADAPTFTFTISGDLTGEYSAGMRIKLTQTTIKYFIITAVSYGAPNTTVTIYGGTDYTLANAAISANYYSVVKAPFGFPLSPAKWTVSISDTTTQAQSNPTSDTWYNLGSNTISIPIGVWNIYYMVGLQVGSGTTITAISMFSTLSTANNSESDTEMSTIAYFAYDHAAANVGLINTFYRQKILSLASKTSYYLNAKTGVANVGVIQTRGDAAKTVIAAVCAYL